jgi:8-oxo-dGTP pyrophosphatase MutT (NUDIX family)
LRGVDARNLPQSRAAGFVLTRTPAGGEPAYLLLVNRRDGMPGFPKGHRDGDETDLETAVRETREESGLTELDVVPGFRAEIAYRVKKGADHRWKSVVYFRAHLRSGEVVLSDEHTSFAWVALPDALRRLSFDSLRDVLRRAALHGKDPALFRLAPPDLAGADRHLASLPHADAALLAHLRGGAALARTFATALATAGVPVHPEATAVGTLLHDVGRALGRHAEHQVAGVEHLRGTAFAPYAFACVSHFTKGASRADLLAAGVAPAGADAFEAASDASVFTWEERCAALADACMKGATPARPADRFADLRARYPGAEGIVALQERRTDAIRREMAAVLGGDPLALVGLA